MVSRDFVMKNEKLKLKLVEIKKLNRVNFFFFLIGSIFKEKSWFEQLAFKCKIGY